jgi:hypothetical protein
LFGELKLTPEQTDKALALCADAGVKRIETFASVTPGALSQAEIAQIKHNAIAELYRQLEPLLGESGVARLEAAQKELPAQTTLGLLNGQLGANQLSGEQSTRLVQVVKAEPFELTEGIIGVGDAAFFGTPQDIQDHLAKVEASNARILQQANSFLSPEQLAALRTVLSNGINSRTAYAAAYIQKH